MSDVLSDAAGARLAIACRAMLTVVAMVLLAACGSSSDDESSATTTTGSDGTTTTTIESQSESGLCDTPDQCADSLYGAWIAADRSRAAGIATPDAVDSLFATTYQPSDNWQNMGCSHAMDMTGCQWTDSTGRTLTMMMSNGIANANPPPPPPPYEVDSATIS